MKKQCLLSWYPVLYAGANSVSDDERIANSFGVSAKVMRNWARKKHKPKMSYLDVIESLVDDQALLDQQLDKYDCSQDALPNENQVAADLMVERDFLKDWQKCVECVPFFKCVDHFRREFVH